MLRFTGLLTVLVSVFIFSVPAQAQQQRGFVAVAWGNVGGVALGFGTGFTRQSAVRDALFRCNNTGVGNCRLSRTSRSCLYGVTGNTVSGYAVMATDTSRQGALNHLVRRMGAVEWQNVIGTCAPRRSVV